MFGLKLEEGKGRLMNPSFLCLRKKIGEEMGNLLPLINLLNSIFILLQIEGEWKGEKERESEKFCLIHACT